jgi:MFS family permease
VFRRGLKDSTDGYGRNVPLLYLFVFFLNFQLWLPVFVVFLQDERDISLSGLTLLEVFFGITLVVFRPISGALADRWGRKPVLALGTITFAATVLLFALAPNFLWLALCYVVWGVSMTMWLGTDAALMFDSLAADGREAEYPRLYGKAYAFMSAAILLGIAIGAPLADLTSLQTPILLSAVSIAIGFVVTLFLKEPPRREAETGLGYVAGLKIAAGIAMRTPALRYPILLWAFVQTFAIATIILTQPFLREHGVAVGDLGWYQLPGEAVAVAAGLSVSFFIARIGQMRLALLLPFLVFGGFLLLGLVDALIAFVAFIAVRGAFGFAPPVYSSVVNAQIDSTNRATILSFSQMVSGLVLTGLMPLLGVIGDEVSLQASFGVAALLFVVLAAPVMVLWARTSGLGSSPVAVAVREAPAASPPA